MYTIDEKISSERYTNEKLQNKINSGVFSANMLALFAELQNAEYPQYNDRWQQPEWVMCRITHDIKTKSGIAFRAGDITICKDEYDTEGYTAYSFRNGIDTVLECWQLELI